MVAGTTDEPREHVRARPLWLAVLLLACAHFAVSTVANHRQFLDLARYAAGLERTPYQYRTLVAWIMRPLGGSSLVTKIAHAFPTPLNAPHTLVLLGIDFLAMLGAVFATRRTLEVLTKDRDFSAWASLLTVAMAYFTFALPYGLDYVVPYDIPSLLAFCLAFLALAAGKRTLFYLTFAIGTLNRETTIFLVVPFAVWQLFDADGSRRPDGARGVALHSVVLVAIWIALKLLIGRLYAGRTPLPDDSGLFETHLGGNLISILKPYQWPLLASLFGFSLPILFRYRGRIDDFRLRRSLEVLLPLWAVAMFVVGVVVEIRVFGELIAPVALGVATIGHRFLRPEAGIPASSTVFPS